MNLRYKATLHPAGDSFEPCRAVAFSPSNGQLISVNGGKTIRLYDDKGTFLTDVQPKPYEKGKTQPIIVTNLAWSPDGTKFIISTSDDVLSIFEVSSDPKSPPVQGKPFKPQTSPIVCLCWPSNNPHLIVFGLADGKVRFAHLKEKRIATLYSSATCPISICASIDGKSILSGHIDGTITQYSFEENTDPVRFARHPCPPRALGWGHSIVVAGNDNKVVFYNPDGSVSRVFDYNTKENQKEFTALTLSPTGQSVIVGSFNSLRVFSYSHRLSHWEEDFEQHIDNLYAVTTLSWALDGSRIAVGTSADCVALFDACLRRIRYKSKYEFVYSSGSHVNVKVLGTDKQFELKSGQNHEITNIRIFKDRYLVANTAASLLLGDLVKQNLSEVDWHVTNKERFNFEHESVCVIITPGELTFVQYGNHDLLGTVRTDFASKNLFSLCNIDDPHHRTTRGVQQPLFRVAYLTDAQTVRILDLNTSITLCTVHNNSKIDLLSLSSKGDRLLFRDKRHRLSLFNVKGEETHILLSSCQHVQWVPETDVIIAQDKTNLCTWYNIDSPDRVSVHAGLKGDVVGVMKSEDGQRNVIVDEGMTKMYYKLNSNFIQFGEALQEKQLQLCADILGRIPLTPETETMWNQLGIEANKAGDLVIAERCAAAVCDVSKARYLSKLNALALHAEQETRGKPGSGYSQPSVKWRIALMNKDFDKAEQILLQQHEVDQAMDMYQRMHKWEDTIRVATKCKHPQEESLKSSYFQWLIKTNQEEKAGKIREREGQLEEAVQLYLKGCVPSEAARVVLTHTEPAEGAVNVMNSSEVVQTDAEFSESIIHSIISALDKLEMFGKAGELYEHLGRFDAALKSYTKGHAFRPAVLLARSVEPGKEKELNKKWGEWCLSQGQIEQAIVHFVDADHAELAIEAAVEHRLWDKAASYLSTIFSGGKKQSASSASLKDFAHRVAEHFESIMNYNEAERFFVYAGTPRDALSMYCTAGLWDAAQKLARQHLSEEEASKFYSSQAKSLEKAGKLKDAEKLYCEVGQIDKAIEMYRKHKMYDECVRVVMQAQTLTSKDKVTKIQQIHFDAAKQLKKEGQFSLAEKHFIEAKQPKEAIKMYEEQEMWEDAVRVAKLTDGQKGAIDLALKRAEAVGGEKGVELLVQMGMPEVAVDFACTHKMFELAFSTARGHCAHKLGEARLKQAQSLQKDRRYEEAEKAYIAAKAFKECVQMYTQLHDFSSAKRVAEMYDRKQLDTVLVGEATMCMERGELTQAESLLNRAKKPQLIVRMYVEANRWEDALRVAQEVNSAYSTHGRDSSQDVDTATLRNLFANTMNEFSVHIKKTNALESCSISELHKIAQLFEDSGDFESAIHTCLAATTGIRHIRSVLQPAFMETSAPAQVEPSSDELESIWMNAVRIAGKYHGVDRSGISREVGQRLKSLNKFDVAAGVYKEAGLTGLAIDAYMSGNYWDQARQTAKGTDKEQEVEREYVKRMQEQKRADELLKHGHTQAAIDVLIQQGNWTEALRAAEKLGAATLARYSAQYTEFLAKNGQISDALQVLVKNGSVASAEYAQMYRNITIHTLARTHDPSVPGYDRQLLPSLRKFLQSLLQNASTTQGTAFPTPQFIQLNYAAYFTHHMVVCQQRKMKEVTASLASSLLRYLDFLPSDRTFFEAGKFCKAAGMTDQAYVYLNQYLDIADAIDAKQRGASDSSEISIPSTIKVPSEHFEGMDPNERTNIKTWVIQKALEKSSEKAIGSQRCLYCGTQVHTSMFECQRCSQTKEPCIVTGMLIPSHSDRAECPSCRLAARKDAWNGWITSNKTCPYCQQRGTPVK
ncbi:putative Intraflagellar transport protein 172 [Blattamonas nauphoetae]|uniref:Intraflagellar transport protein 172 n=1 Tax=Blattamonas nauphoetae TaxID=2049346 RepID=A0ABQ9X9T3_9EUKA|nr:putative Intraflagellar transport protein 172 [Blattamonas nauphoetae]